MFCLGPVCTTPNGWCVFILVFTAIGILWAWKRFGAVGW
jgi:hypothetical protein